MTSIPAALKNNFGAEFDMSSGLIHLTLGDYLSYQAGSFIPQVDLALLSADLNIKSGALPVPKFGSFVSHTREIWQMETLLRANTT